MPALTDAFLQIWPVRSWLNLSARMLVRSKSQKMEGGVVCMIDLFFVLLFFVVFSPNLKCAIVGVGGGNIAFAAPPLWWRVGSSSVLITFRRRCKGNEIGRA